MKKAFITSIGIAHPPLSIAQPEAKEFLNRNYAGKLTPASSAVLDKVFAHPSISKRYFAFDTPDSLVGEGADVRMSRFQQWSVDLSATAVERAMDDSGVAPGDVSAIVVNTCTGYLCPGISTYLIEKLDLPRSVKAYDLVGSGCGGALPNIEIASQALNGNENGAVLSVSVEICSATFQMEDDLSLIVSNALFGDGAAAAVIRRQPGGFEILDSSTLYLPEFREAVRFIYKNGDLHNRISVRLPGMIKSAVQSVVGDLLKAHSLTVSDIGHWAVHAGGDRIIDAVQCGLGLSADDLEPTRAILAEYGNMSSATVWFVMDEILRNGIKKDDLCVGITFGAGLSAHAMLLRKA